MPDVNGVETLSAALQRNADRAGSRPAMLDGGHSVDWSRYTDRVACTAARLRASGVRPGDRIAIIALNSARQAELTHAAWWAGITPAPVNYRLAPPEIRSILEAAACRRIVVGTEFRELFDQEALRPHRDDCLDLEALVPPLHEAGDTVAPHAPHEASASDEALLLFTGGTSGRAKGVPLTHRNILANAAQIGGAWQACADDVVLHVPPMFHSAELVPTVYLLSGAAHAYLPRYEPRALLQAIQAYRASFVLLVPTVIILTLQSESLDEFDLGSLRQLIYGASPMSLPWIERTLESFKGIEIAQGYGLTETAPLLTMLVHQDHVDALSGGSTGRLASCGRVLHGVSLSVADEHGSEVTTGETGEIYARGDNVFAGYLADPELTDKAFADGWFRTGDVGRLDEDGYLYLLDRVQDVILSGGEKIYSSEVEAVLHSHPLVSECAVIGVPDEIFGERLTAVVTTRHGCLPDTDDLLAHCRRHIGGYKVPKDIRIVESLPKSAMGKVLKHELRDTLGGHRS